MSTVEVRFSFLVGGKEAGRCTRLPLLTQSLHRGPHETSHRHRCLKKLFRCTSKNV